MIELFKNKPSPVNINFRVEPRDFMSDRVLLPLETIEALNKAAHTLKSTSKERYEIVLTRGYIHWGRWRYFRGILAKTIFCFLYWNNKSDAKLLFSANGHDDGFSVDVQLYDVDLQTVIQFLSWRNVIMPRTTAEKFLETNKHLVSMLDRAMSTAGFIVHPDPREKLQMHYRLMSFTSTKAKGK